MRVAFHPSSTAVVDRDDKAKLVGDVDIRLMLLSSVVILLGHGNWCIRAGDASLTCKVGDIKGF